ncbi:MAG TPA: glutamate synthase large subunit [Gemmatimonadales bacterium]|nr:glutamate synthase large subunit [Gemmatimonadales bacterium]
MPDGDRSHWTHARAPGLDPWREHDACGVGFVARASGEPSADITARALQALARVAHRGAAATDRSGDGAGLLTQIPAPLFYRAAASRGLALDPGTPFAVGSFFLPRDATALTRATAIIEDVLRGEGLPLLGWRDVPVDLDVLGAGARASCPTIRHAILGAPDGERSEEAAWERSLYLARRIIERRVAAEAGGGLDPFFVCSLSRRTIVYKALLTGTQLPGFFPDLRSPDYQTALAVFHQRYSTNTTSSWPLAQPFRLLAHNGEINTLWGNRNAMRAREPALAAPVWGEAVDRLKPVVWAEGSDSASLDNALELLVRSGRDPVHALMMLVPEAHEGAVEMEPALRGFYEFHECLMEPWDGPAALAFSDGVVVGSALDRNGLRPCRYKITRDGLVVAGSEVGLVDLDPAEVVESGRLGPGELLVVDTRRKAILRNTDAKREVARRRPYARWAARGILPLRPTAAVPETAPLAEQELVAQQISFGWSFEDLRYVLEPMGGAAQDAVWSMGDDTPIPPLARVPPPIYAYVRQRFAQVTNPPIDPLRETLVMSLRMHLGRRSSLLADRLAGLRLVRNEHPILLTEEMAALRAVAGAQAVTLDATWEIAEGSTAAADTLRGALDRLCRAAGRAVRQGARIVILSDRAADRERAPLPMALAVGAVHQHLLENGLRTRLGLVAEAGDAWDVHHFAALIGYGAEAVHPWLALDSVRRQVEDEGAPLQFRSAAEKGLLKILSKMGISTLSSYCGAQTFEALGLGAEVIDRCFTGTVSTIGGIGFAEIAEDVLARQRAAYPDPASPQPVLPDHGRVRYRRDGEDHGWSPPLVRAMQHAVARDSGPAYDEFLARVAARLPASPRDLLALRTGTPIPLDQVEPAEEIRRRFISTAMSLGALSPEAHRTLAIGMNRMGARSNSGEGGEDPDTYLPLPNGDRADNRIKQVASGRFGVTTQYLLRADELEIKMAQGSKPGEGGQLPGHKVTALIARLRHSVPGVPLISPPPHHDIYSIEDLAQLIHDLKQVNPRARVGVKLVAEAGVGRVAAGVAKAYADYVLISGHNGGTGASPLSSIKHAGSPWELGLAETQALLIENGLRHRIEVRTDGGLRTGRDVVIAALLGAETYGFGTAALVAIGCSMARQCHLNSCPTGVATQRPELRAKFKGTPEQVVAYFTWIAEDVRRILAEMGYGSLNDVIGRAELLERVDRPEVPRAQMLDLSVLLADPLAEREAPRRRTLERNDRPGVESLDDEIWRELGPRLESDRPFAGVYDIGNHHLTVGARIAGRIAQRGNVNLAPGSIRLRFRGSAGQSFGAFAVAGMRLELEGEANDYVGKGLSGGDLVLRPFQEAAGVSERHRVILGNTALYGATGGTLFAAGRAGDRFAVRNSGAVAVIEGAGDHCCEYMTAGTVVVLGPVGRNFAAGMSNGAAYVLDEAEVFLLRCNPDMVAVRELNAEDEGVLQHLIREHAARTGSLRARAILLGWSRYRPFFRKVVPHSAPVPAPALEPVETAPAEQLTAGDAPAASQ